MHIADIDSDKSAQEVDAGPRSPLRTVQVLRELASIPGGLTLVQLATRLQLPKTSVFRLLRSLEAGGYVTSIGGAHHLGSEALKLGSAIVQNLVFPNCARPAMEWLFEQCQETIIIGVQSDDGYDVVYREVIEATNPLRFSVAAGTTKPLYTSASGQAVIAHMPDDVLKHYLSTVQFQQFAPKTIGSVADLKRRIREVRANGVAVSIDGMFEGVYSVAAPIVDSGMSVRAGISITAPSTRGIRQSKKFAELVHKAGEEISRVLGYAGEYPPVL
ncbi:helix-turn-helix domain-containing protein [Bordetella petrii]|nr:helix-turn-helix domain-containing protein [Bordetella petrii]